MNKEALKVVGVVVLALLLLGAGTAVAGVAYREIRNRASLPPRADLDRDVATRDGVIITSVVPGSPAAQAGIARGDILLKIDDRDVHQVNEVQRIIRRMGVGDQVKLAILHGDEVRTHIVTLDERNDQAFLGITLCCGREEPSGAEDIPRQIQGALILDVLLDSPAERAGLREGDVILSVDGQELSLENDLPSLISMQEPGDIVTLEIRRAGESETREISVRLGEHPDRPGHGYLGVSYQFVPDIITPGGEQSPGEGFPFTLPPLGEERVVPPDYEEHRFEFFGPHSEQHPYFHLPCEGELRGVLILDVVQDSPASKAGLFPGDLIVAIDGQPVGNQSIFREVIASRSPGDEVRLTLHRLGTGEEIDIRVQLGEHPDERGRGYLGVLLGPIFHYEYFSEGEFHPPMPCYPYENLPYWDGHDLQVQPPLAPDL